MSLDGTPVLHGVDLTVGPGEWVTVIGPNGAGKSTLLRAVGGLVPADGRVDVGGAPAGRLRAPRSGPAWWPSSRRARWYPRA